MSRAQTLAAAALCVAVALLVAWWFRGDDASHGSASPRPSIVDAVRATPQLALSEPAPVVTPLEPSGASMANAEADMTRVEAPLAAAITNVTVYGYVRPDPRRAALVDDEVYVALTDIDGRRWNARCGSDGAYSISGLTPGEYWLRAGSVLDGQARRRTRLDGTQDAQRIDLELALQREVWIRVVDTQGEPLELALTLVPVATLAPPGEWFDEVRGSLNNPFGVGSFYRNGFAGERRSKHYLGWVSIQSDDPVWVSLVRYQRVLASVQHDGEAELEFIVDPQLEQARSCGLRARFIDARTQTPLAGANFSLESTGMRMSALDEDGGLSVERLDPGLYCVRVSRAGLEGFERRLRLEPGEVRDLGEVMLAPERWIAGVVQAPSGPAAQIEVHYVVLDELTGEPQWQSGLRMTRTGADGSFRIAQLTAQRYQLSIERPGDGLASRRTFVDLRSGPADDVRLELVAGAPLVVWADDRDWQGLTFTVADEHGVVLRDAKLWSPGPFARTLRPGRYSLECRKHGQPIGERREFVLADAPVRFQLP